MSAVDDRRQRLGHAPVDDGPGEFTFVGKPAIKSSLRYPGPGGYDFHRSIRSELGVDLPRGAQHARSVSCSVGSERPLGGQFYHLTTLTDS